MKLDPLQFDWVKKRLTGTALGEEQDGLSGCDNTLVTTLNPPPTQKELSDKFWAIQDGINAELDKQLLTMPAIPEEALKHLVQLNKLHNQLTGVTPCDHVWVTSGGPSSCAKCGAKPVKVDDILGAKAALEEKKDVLGYKAAQILYYDKKTLEKLKQQTPLGNYQNTQNAQQNANQSQSLSGELGGLGGSGYGYQIKFSESLKTTWTDPNEGFTSAGDAEKFVIKIAMLTNMNVNLQGKGYGFNKKYRLKCDKCGSIQEVPREIADRYDSDASVIADFCKNHKHIVEPKEVRGRKFREAV